jgi:tartrate-resistant acid phosphatase type 5
MVCLIGTGICLVVSTVGRGAGPAGKCNRFMYPSHITKWLLGAILLIAAGLALPWHAARAATPGTVRVAVIGDYGDGSQPEADVANLVRSWSPDAVITVGDNNYPDGAATTIDPHVGQFYHQFISPYTGSYGAGAATNQFFPALGNHDWNTARAAAYFSYFALPGNERYYDYVLGPIHFFVVDSDYHEPDGITSTSAQATWLRDRLAAATEPWKLVYFHHSPYTSGVTDGPTPEMRWPFQQWGATAVLSGHEHNYERIVLNGFPYFVNGLGGCDDCLYPFGPPVPGSQVRFTGEYGAMQIEASSNSIAFSLITRLNQTIDTYTINAVAGTATPANTAVPTATQAGTATLTPASTRTPTATRTATWTPIPTDTAVATATQLPIPTDTAVATATPAPPPPTATPLATVTRTATPAGSFTLSVTPASQTVLRNQNKSYSVTLTSVNGYSGRVSLSVSGLPAHTNASFNPNALTLNPGGTAASTLKISAQKSAPPGTYQLTVKATAGSLTATQAVTLVIQ